MGVWKMRKNVNYSIDGWMAGVGGDSMIRTWNFYTYYVNYFDESKTEFLLYAWFM